jgi:hypothetical protein
VRRDPERCEEYEELEDMDKYVEELEDGVVEVARFAELRKIGLLEKRLNRLCWPIRPACVGSD